MPAFCMTIALRPGGLDARWVPLPGASLAECRALIGDWLAGLNNQRSSHGPALIIIPAGESALAGHVGLGDRGDPGCRACLQDRPHRRGRGYATRAAQLTAQLLLHEQNASMAELRVGAGNTASQRVAAAAGFTPARPSSHTRPPPGNLRRPSLRLPPALTSCQGQTGARPTARSAGGSPTQARLRWPPRPDGLTRRPAGAATGVPSRAR